MNPKKKHWASITAGILSLASYVSAASLGSEKYTYDASGNIIEKSIDGRVTKMSFDNANRLACIQQLDQNKEEFSYDAAGRPIRESGHAERTANYGYGDRVLEARNGGSKSSLFYNAEGQLVGKKTDDKIRTYTWDGNALAADGADAFTNESHISGGVPVLFSGKDVVASDYLGNTLLSGITQFVSTAYGEGLEAGRFTGKIYVGELEAFLFPNRLYSATSSRWTSSDSSGFPDGTNSRSYVSGDPLSKLDPSGLSEVDYPDTTLTPGTYEIKVQVKVTWDTDNAPAKAAGSDKLVGQVANPPNTTPVFTWTSPNTVVSSPGVWDTRTEGDPPTIRYGWYKDVELDADASFTLNGNADTKKSSYSYMTHHIQIEL